MKIKLTEDFCRSLARNLLFNTNENVNLLEMSMSPEKTADYGSKINPQAGNFEFDIFNRPGPMSKSRSERTQFEEKSEDMQSLSDLPIDSDMVNYEIEGVFDNKSKKVQVKKGKK